MNVLKKIYMVGPSLKTQGGISTVLNIYNTNFRELGLKFIPSYSGRNRLLDILLFLYALVKVLAASLLYKGVIFHINSASNGSFFRKSILAKMALFFGRKVVFHVHGGGFGNFIENSKENKRNKIISLLCKTHRVIVLSDSWKDYFSKYLPQEKTIVLNNPCPIADISYNTRNNPKTKILFTGRLSKAKGIYDLIEAVGLLTDGSFQLEAYGDGELEKVCDFINKRNLGERVLINNWKPYDQILEIYRGADIFVLPSYTEGMPMSILEAMGSGLPIISTNVGGIPEAVINNENGFLINPGDIAALTEKLDTLIRDKALREEMGRKSLGYIKTRFSIETIGEKLEKIYEEL
jgi:glycosyltransferase involved in cell wall biosynthesis